MRGTGVNADMRTLFVVLVLGLMVAGCSGGNDSAEKIEKPKQPPLETQPVTPEVEKQQPPADPQTSEIELAEARKPAIDTSVLRDAPGWQLMDLSGQRRYSGEMVGKVVIFDFWATWCGPCKMEIPHFIELQNEYDGQLEIVGVAMDRQGRQIVEPFVRSAGINYITVLGDQRVVEDYSPITGLPTTFVISQDGKIYKRYVGFRPKSVFENDIRTLLGLEPKTAE